MSFFELNSFESTFYYAEGEPYDSDFSVSEKPKSIWQAVCSCKDLDPKKWEHIAIDVFGMASAYFLSEEAVMQQIEKVNTCSNLTAPIQVWIDEQGFFTLNVY